MRNLLTEIIFIGLITIIIGFISTRVLSGNVWPPLNHPDILVMLFNYFVIGATLHYFFEISGINQRFCE